MAGPPESIPKNDRSLWKGLVVGADELTPPKPSRAKWLILATAVVAAAAAFVIYRFA